jgi:hypothetical protein
MAEEAQADQGPAATPQAKEEAKRGVTHARKAAEDLGSTAGGIADEYRGRGKKVWDGTRYRVQSLQQDRKQYLRATPTRAALTALGVRLVIGLIFRR